METMTTGQSPRNSLPTIKTMYQLTARKNPSWGLQCYSTPKFYEDPIKLMQQRSLLDGTKKKSYCSERRSYLDQMLKTNSTPGPGAYNIVTKWKKLKTKEVAVDRKTYVDGIFEQAQKNSQPGPDAYQVGETDEKVKDKLMKMKARKRGVSERVNFADNCQCLGAEVPGPGQYNPRPSQKNIHSSRFAAEQYRKHYYGKQKDGVKKHRKQQSSENNSPVKSDTFQWRSLFPEYFKQKKHNWGDGPRFLQDIHNKNGKQNIDSISPGPGSYNINTNWKGKIKNKQQKTLTYFQTISRGRKLSVYH